MKTKFIDITYDKAREMFYDSDNKFFDHEAAIGDEIRSQDNNI